MPGCDEGIDEADALRWDCARGNEAPVGIQPAREAVSAGDEVVKEGPINGGKGQDALNRLEKQPVWGMKL